MVLGKLDSNMQKNEAGPLSYTNHKNKLKMDKDLNVRQEAIKILEEKAVKNLFDLGHSNFLLHTSPEARDTKAKMNFGTSSKQKAAAQQRKQSAKLKGNQWNGRRNANGMQTTYQIKG